MNRTTRFKKCITVKFWPENLKDNYYKHKQKSK